MSIHLPIFSPDPPSFDYPFHDEIPHIPDKWAIQSLCCNGWGSCGEWVLDLVGEALCCMYGCDGVVTMPGEAHHTGNYYCSISVGVVKSDTGHSQSAPWNPVFHDWSVGISLIQHEPVGM